MSTASKLSKNLRLSNLNIKEAHLSSENSRIKTKHEFLNKKTKNSEGHKDHHFPMKKKHTDTTQEPKESFRANGNSSDKQKMTLINSMKIISSYMNSANHLTDSLNNSKSQGSLKNSAYSALYYECRLSCMSSIKLLKPKYKNNSIIPVLPSVFNKFFSPL